MHKYPPVPTVFSYPSLLSMPSFSNTVSSTASIRIAPAPFDGNERPDYDLVLRTIDHVDYRVHKLILSLSSSVFEGMFGLPEQTTDFDELDEGNRPVVAITETSRATHLMLSFCYPNLGCPVGTLDASDFATVLEALRKYQMDGQLSIVRNLLLTSGLLESAPLSVFSISCAVRWREGAEKAALQLLRLRRGEWDEAPGLESISGLQYHRLLNYHRRCSAAASACADPQKWFIPGARGNKMASWRRCNSDTCSSGIVLKMTPTDTAPIPLQALKTVPRAWFLAYMEASQRELAKLPLAEAVTSCEFVEPFMKQAISCDTCRDQVVVNGMKEVKERMNAEVNAAISREKIELGF